MILMTERGGAIIFIGFWRSPIPPSTDATKLNYLNDKEEWGGGAIIVCRILAHPPLQTPQYIRILMTEKGGAPLSCEDLRIQLLIL